MSLNEITRWEADDQLVRGYTGDRHDHTFDVPKRGGGVWLADRLNRFAALEADLERTRNILDISATVRRKVQVENDRLREAIHEALLEIEYGNSGRAHDNLRKTLEGGEDE